MTVSIPEEVELIGATMEVGGGSGWVALAVMVVVGTCAARACRMPVWILSSTLATRFTTVSETASLSD